MGIGQIDWSLMIFLSMLTVKTAQTVWHLFTMFSWIKIWASERTFKKLNIFSSAFEIWLCHIYSLNLFFASFSKVAPEQKFGHSIFYNFLFFLPLKCYGIFVKKGRWYGWPFCLPLLFMFSKNTFCFLIRALWYGLKNIFFLTTLIHSYSFSHLFHNKNDKWHKLLSKPA